MIQADVVVLGAGPAGSEAAYQLSERGLRVVVLEKESLNREKPCGGAIQTGELLEFGSPPEEVIERRIYEARIFGPNETSLPISTRHENQSGITVKRSAYNHWLVKRADKAQFIEHAMIAVLTRSGNRWQVIATANEETITIETPLIVHAAGASSSLLERNLGLEPFSYQGMGITCQFWLQSDQFTLNHAFGNSLEFHFIPDRIPEGYFWLFPKRDILVIGVGTTMDVVRAGRLSLLKELKEFMPGQLARLGFPPDIPHIRQDGGKVPMKLRTPISGDGLLVVGDAAGVGSIIHGGGIYQARKTAFFAAEAAADYLDGDSNALVHYEERVKTYFTEHERRWDRRLKPFLTDEHLVNLILDKGRNDEAIREGLGILLSSTEGHRRAYELIEEASFALIAEELDFIIGGERDLVNAELAKLFIEDSNLHRIVNEVLLCGGKRLRAVLVLLVGQALGAAMEDLMPVALAYEVSHTASLVHDDIIDGGEWRRGAETLHRKYGLGHAVTAGDALLIKGFEMMIAYSHRPGIDKNTLINLINVGCRSGLRASEGEVQDINFSPHEIEGKKVEDYINLIRLKTGALLEAATEAGAVLAKSSEDITSAMRKFGCALGIAFQIYDDAKDLLASSSISLKSRFTDIRKGKLTAQLIHTVNAASEDDRRRLLQLLSMGTSEGVEEILEIYRRYDALQFNQKLSRQYLREAKEKLEVLPESPSREKLEGIIRALGYWTRFVSHSEEV